jgi:hypothetical protein
MGCLHLGALSVLLSDSMVSAFTSAAAVQVFTSYFPMLFDIELPPMKYTSFRLFKVNHQLLFPSSTWKQINFFFILGVVWVFQESERYEFLNFWDLYCFFANTDCDYRVRWAKVKEEISTKNTDSYRSCDCEYNQVSLLYLNIINIKWIKSCFRW